MKYRILLVDDNPVTRQNTKLVFDNREDEWEIVEAGDTHDLSLVLEEGKTYDGALLDIMLPGVSGIEIGKALKERFSPFCVIYVSARTDPQTQQQAKEEGRGDAYFTKPIDPDSFYQAVRTLFQATLGKE